MTMFGLSRDQGRLGVSLGWPEPELKMLSAYLRARRLPVGAILGHLVEVRARHRIAVYQGTALDALDQLLDEVDALDALPPPLRAYTDGSGTHEASAPAGAGVALYQGEELLLELSLDAGLGTNNHAELYAVAAALRAIPLLDRAVELWSDSTYAIGAATSPEFYPRANAVLVRQLRADVLLRPNLTMHHVDGHQKVTLDTPPELVSHINGNNRADALAGRARRKALGQPEPVDKTPKPRRIGKMRRATMPRRLVP